MKVILNLSFYFVFMFVLAVRGYGFEGNKYDDFCDKYNNVVNANGFAAGDGSTENPFVICNAEQLNNVKGGFNYFKNFLNFVLGNDINMRDLGKAKFNMIGCSKDGFKGVFDGNNHKINNLDIDENNVVQEPASDNSSKEYGLILRLGEGGLVKNLALTNVRIISQNTSAALVIYNDGTINNSHSSGIVTSTGDGSKAAGLVAWNKNGTILNSTSSVTVTSSGKFSKTGGLVAFNEGTINNSSSNGSIKSSGEFSKAGGLVAYNKDIINSSYSNGAITSYGETSYAGGLVGMNEGTISNSYSNGSVISDGDYSFAGGLVGWNEYPISNSYSSGTVASSGDFSYAGGLVACNYDLISNSYSRETVISSGDFSYAGGLVAFNTVSIEYTYSSGKVTNEFDERRYAGGLVAKDEGQIFISYCDKNFTYFSQSRDARGLAVKDLKNFNFPYFDFVNTWKWATGRPPKLMWEE